jgi:nucleoside-triphosphatase THEP1
MEKARHKSVKMMNEEKSDHKIFLFAVTGGPCAGKTTSLQYLSERFAPKFKVFVVPEMASLTVQAGVSIIPSNFTPASHTGNKFF